MKKILLRTAMLPTDNLNTFQILTEDKLGTNAGNMFFPYSLSRLLMTDETVEIHSIVTTRSYSDEFIAHLNETYDCFVIPLANAFRRSFVEELKRITRLIKKLDMPCIVVGVGLQAGVNDTGDAAFPFDEEVKDFVRAVLEKSSIVGLRGEITANYLKHLGFREEEDYTVIGCPSMFIYGDRLPAIKKKELTSDSIVCINRKIDIPPQLHDFLTQCEKEFSHYYFIPQNTFDYRLLYAGIPITETQWGELPDSYPQHYLDPCFSGDHVRGFVNVPSWLAFLSQATFNFGSRIHGNIAGILAGCPSYIFVSDSRILELAQYHHIPHMLAKNIDEQTNIYDIYARTDFDMVHDGHKARFAHYHHFLNENGLPTVYDEGRQYEQLPFDAKMAALTLEPPIIPLMTRSPEERMHITEEYYRYYIGRCAKLQHQLKKEEAAAKNRKKSNRIKRMIKRVWNKK